MQIVRLVDPGMPDKLIAFDTLPDEMLRLAEQIDPKNLGLARHWVALGKQYALYYKTLNNHVMAWSEICSFVPRNVKSGTRLRDDLASMAINAAPTSNEAIRIEPEDIPLIRIVKGQNEEEVVETVEKLEPVVSQELKVEHAKNCGSLGRGNKYTAGCPRCDQLSGKLVTSVK